MKHFKLFFLIPFLVFCTNTAISQQAAAVDSIKAALKAATTPQEKVIWLDELSRTLMNVDLKEAENYGAQLIRVAEESRDRKLMFKSLMSNGVRCMYFAQQKAFSSRSIEYFNQALQLAQQNKMEEEVGAAQLHLSMVYLMIPDKEKALSYVTQAFSLISTLNNDSLKAEAHNTYGQVYMERNEKMLALRNYFSGLRLAEDIKNHYLIKNSYLLLSNFYSEIEDYDKAIDYMGHAYSRMDYIKTKDVPYQKVVLTNNMGRLYSFKKNYDIAISYYDKSIRMADSLKFSTLKLPGYISLLNQYLEMKEPQRALTFLNSPQGTSLKGFLSTFGMSSTVDLAYGVTYRELGRYDSAGIFFEKAKPGFEQSTNESNSINFFRQLATYYRKSGDKKKAIEYYLKVKEIGERNGFLDYIQSSAKYLDTLYAQTGNMPQSGIYKATYYQYKDSIDKLGREKELAQIEASDVQQREIKLEKEREENKKRRNNIQYLAIVIGIIGLFVALVILGMFKVSAGVIKAIGFFVFIMFFEFIFLIFKKNIYSLTNGEPWKDLAFMIALAALLVPLHHWLEHKVLHYLTSHNRLTSAGHHIRNKIFRRTKAGEQ
jgi:tetratricopeptide (TPR) repeat protein